MNAHASQDVLPPRFQLEGRLGTGGFGAVFVVTDRETGTRMALKRLERVDPGSLYRFKQEFRALAGLRHPNLVRLGELFAVENTWCFTMELVEGTRFDDWVKGTIAPRRSARAEDEPSTPGPDITEIAAAPGSEGSARPFDEGRLRAALRGLVSGVLALHAEGILHRDLKPSNVLVTPEGRVVILDFGLVATGVIDEHVSIDGAIAGTPAYMSPEQARGAPLTAASDLYAVGLMLYEALAGHPPFSGTAAEILAERTTRMPRDPRTIWPGLPDDLCDLCMSLLSLQSGRRPRAADLAAAVGLPAPDAGAGRASSPGAFVGRGRELATLQQALQRARAGKPVVVHLHGPSGIGKTALAKRFVTNAESDGNTVVLQGRCYDRESVPYKALDEVVDALGRHLRRLPRLEAAGLLPRDGRALLRLFPTLGRVDLLATLPGRDPTSDPHELRRRGFAALRELLARLCDTRPVVVVIDDVQWGDRDSAAVLEALVAPPEPPPLMLVLLGREDAASGDILRALTRPAPGASVVHEVLDLPIEPLPPPEAELLAQTLLTVAGARSGDARTLARESGGSPLFVGELVRALASGARRPDEITLQAVLTARVAALPPPARALLEVVACAGRPEDESLLIEAVGLSSTEATEAFERLRQEHLVGMSTASGRCLVELLYDQVRASVLGALPEDRARTYHQALAERLDARGEADPETLAQHYSAAGQAPRAAPHAERAGDRAAEALAFEHAVRLYASALEAAGSEDRARLRRKLADANAAAGRGAEAGAAYMACAAEESGDQALELRRRAAEQYLRAGRVAEGLDAARPVCERTGIDLPRTPKRAVAALLLSRARLKLRGLDYKKRAEAAVPADDLRRIDLCWALASGLAGIDVVRSTNLHTRHLLMALNAGEPARIARALGMTSILSSIESMAGVARGKRLAERAIEIAHDLGDHPTLCWGTTGKAVGAWAETRLEECARLCEEALALFREQGKDIFREMGSIEVWFNQHARFLMGRLQEVATRASACVAEARARGDRYTETTMRMYIVPLVWLAVDRPGDARREVREAIDLWGQEGPHHQHWCELRAHCCIDLYEGQGERVVHRIEKTRAAMKASFLLRARTPRLEHTYLEARGLLDAAWAAPNASASEALLDQVERAAGRLDEEGNGLASVYARALRAGVAARRGNVEITRKAFSDAAEAFAALNMPLHAAAARWRLGELGGGEGMVTIATASSVMSEAGVVSPERFARMLLPRAG